MILTSIFLPMNVSFIRLASDAILFTTSLTKLRLAESMSVFQRHCFWNMIDLSSVFNWNTEKSKIMETVFFFCKIINFNFVNFVFQEFREIMIFLVLLQTWKPKEKRHMEFKGFSYIAKRGSHSPSFCCNTYLLGYKNIKGTWLMDFIFDKFFRIQRFH